MKLKIKKLDPAAVIPSYAKDGDACFDLTAQSVTVTENYIQYGTGLAMEIPDGYVGVILPRSSITNKDLMLKNSVGIIDSGYRGEICFRFHYLRQLHYIGSDKIQFKDKVPVLGLPETEGMYSLGERVGQMMILPIPKVEFIEVDELSDSDRGEGGYGSTGK